MPLYSLLETAEALIHYGQPIGENLRCRSVAFDRAPDNRQDPLRRALE